MYFDFRLWQLTVGLRLGMLGGVALGLLALIAGIARFVFLGQLLARVYTGASWWALAVPMLGVAAMILLRALFDHLRTAQANRHAAQVQHVLRGQLYDCIVRLGPA